ncbi:Capsule biosynthesis protein CapA [Microbacterium oxydans]|uniref:CapA family protein n=1 Tax=Microbacterium oxydans TaxID=82380 RepID=UPI001DED8907|nr:CapA family protein [Microbacterium oxydans]CAH0175763.1 Capsule biosynthesis protein CapA [Microbacterium oxydans]
MIRIHAVGDLVLERADSWPLLEAAAPVLQTADVVIGHLEIPHLDESSTHTVHSTDVPAIPGTPAALDGLVAAGFTMLTLAGNHIYDFGPEGIRETQEHCAARGLQTAGVGETLDEALRPMVSEVDGTRIAVLSVNCVGPRETWASSLKPGAAYVEVTTHYEPRGANPGGPPRIRTYAEPQSLERVLRAVRRSAEENDIVIVALHKGLVHTPIDLADYEREVSHAVIDAGAHAVIGHHAHIMRGVEIYRDRLILHGLGNFATVTRALSARPGDAPERAAWARQRRRIFGFDPDPEMPDYPFHPESRNTAIAELDISEGAVSAALIPCWIEQDARPVPVGRSERGESVADYLRTITTEAGFSTRLVWDEDRLVVRGHDD